MNIISQFIGFIGTFLIILSYQINDRKKIIVVQGLAGIFFTVHFIMLGAFTGAMMNLLTSIRAGVYYNRDRKWAQNRIWLIVFSALYLGAGIITYDSPLSLIIMFAMVLNTCVFWMTNTTMIRILIIPCSLSWLIYNLFSHSIAGFVTEAFASTSIIISIIRFDVIPLIKRKSKTQISK